MVELYNLDNFKLYLKYALRDLSRSYSKILSIIVTLFISLFILSSILTVEDSLETELNNNSRLLLGGDIEIDDNRVLFYQAEDGIRDSPVTGVQTCALPIFDSIYY